MRFFKRLVIFLAIAVILSPISSNQPLPPKAQAATWTRVNTSGFGDAGLTYSPPVVFNNQIYVAVAKDTGGNRYTEIWRSNDGSNNSWTKIVSNGLTGQIGPNNTGDIHDFFVGTDNNLYLTNDPNWNSADCSQPSNCRLVWKSADGTNWSPVSPNNFQGISQSSQKKTAITQNDFGFNTGKNSGKFVSFKNKIFVATAKHDMITNNPNFPPDCKKGEVFSSADNGASWQAAWNNTGPNSGIGDDYTCGITDLTVYKNELYASTVKWSSLGKLSQILKTADGVTWTDTAPTGILQDHPLIVGLTVLSSNYGDEFFAAGEFVLSTGAPAAVYRSTDGQNWSKITTAQDLSHSGNIDISAFRVINGQLLVGTKNVTNGAEVWRTGPGGPLWENMTAGVSGFGSSGNTRIGGFLINGNYIYATTWNTSAAKGVQIWRTPLVPPPVPQCNSDIAILLDLSLSMNQTYIDGTGTKMGVARNVLKNTVLPLIAGPRNGSRIALLTFYAIGPVNNTTVHLDSQFFGLDAGSDFADPNNDNNLSSMRTKIDNLVPTGGTPMADAIKKATQMFLARSQARPPVVIYVGDGSPTIDLAHHVYDNNDTDAIDLRDRGTAFRPEPEVRADGPVYPWGTHAGAALADVMITADQMVTQIPDLASSGFSIAIEALNGFFNKSVMQYVGYKGGGAFPGFNSFDPQTIAELKDAFQSIIQVEACNSHLIVNLPPKLLSRPTAMYFGGNTYTISGTTVTGCTGSRCGEYIVTIEGGHFEDAVHDSRSEYYRLDIKRFRRALGSDTSIPDDPVKVYGFRLVFDSPMKSADISTVDQYLNNGNNNPPSDTATVFIGDDNCSPLVGGTSICLRTFLTADVPGISGETPLILLQRINRKALLVEGNVAAPGTLSQFQLDSKAIAVGGNVQTTGGSANLNNYFNSSGIAWGNVNDPTSVAGKLNNIFNRRNSSPPINLAEFSDVTDISWNLNSSTTDPANGASNSFSTGPEGKLWNVVVPNGQTFVFGHDPNQTLTFRGSGTIVLSHPDNSPVDVNLNAGIDCGAVSTARLAIITQGKITFKKPNGGNSQVVGCGSYTSLERDIEFEDATAGQVKGIFVAKGNVTLPNPQGLLQSYIIRYDSTLANNPPVLLRELLKVIFSTTS